MMLRLTLALAPKWTVASPWADDGTGALVGRLLGMTVALAPQLYLASLASRWRWRLRGVGQSTSTHLRNFLVSQLLPSHPMPPFNAPIYQARATSRSSRRSRMALRCWAACLPPLVPCAVPRPSAGAGTEWAREGFGRVTHPRSSLRHQRTCWEGPPADLLPVRPTHLLICCGRGGSPINIIKLSRHATFVLSFRSSLALSRPCGSARGGCQRYAMHWTISPCKLGVNFRPPRGR